MAQQSDETIPLIARARSHAAGPAAVDGGGCLTYPELLSRSQAAAAQLLLGERDLAETRVAFLAPPGIEYVVTQWGIWRAGAIAVPLCTSHPAPELDYVLEDAGVRIVIAHPHYAPTLGPLAQARGLRFLTTDAFALPELSQQAVALPRVDADRGAMLIYTSGTTGKPKAALSTHAILAAQIRSVVEAWEWSERDRALHVLPLHHLHGILNLLCASLWSGAACEFMARFDAERVFHRIARREPGAELTLFMAVPTVYAKLIRCYEEADPAQRRAFEAGCRALRLMVSGSAALPLRTLERWRAISGHTLLERYGMTEIGMALGNPLHGERRAGYVGTPFPGVELRLVDTQGRPVPDGEPGQIQVRGPNVFREYWGRPKATRAAFTDDGWFITGDLAQRDAGSYRILGRESVDILKSGGFKISALEVEDLLREHPAIAECAVVGVPDEVWGQRVAAAAVLTPGCDLSLEELRDWGKERLARYKVPSLLRAVTELPRNAMGKVQKTEVVRLFTAPAEFDP